MTWTYSGDPASNNRDQIRFLIGDTDTNDQLLNDAEIAYELAENSSGIYRTAAAALRAVIARGRFVDKSVDGLSVSASQRAAQANELAEYYDRRTTRAVPIYAGGMSISEAQSYDDDTNIPPFQFEMGQFSYPSTGSTST